MTDKYRLIEEGEGQILSEQVLLAYRQLPITVISSFIMAALIMWVASSTIPMSYLASWFSAIVFFGAARLMMM